MKNAKSITVEQFSGQPNESGAKGNCYYVVSAKNTTEVKLGQWLSETELNAWMETGIDITIKPRSSGR